MRATVLHWRSLPSLMELSVLPWRCNSFAWVYLSGVMRSTLLPSEYPKIGDCLPWIGMYSSEPFDINEEFFCQLLSTGVVCPWLNFDLSSQFPQVVSCPWGIFCHAGSGRFGPGLQSVISPRKIPQNTPPPPGIEPGPRGGLWDTFPTELS